MDKYVLWKRVRIARQGIHMGRAMKVEKNE
jgi:hypothetical protein